MVPPAAIATAPATPEAPATKDPVRDTILTPRFYTTDFDAMAAMDLQPNVLELEAICEEFRKDYNRHHFVRNDEFDGAAAKLDPKTRQVFVEFLEQSCTSEFSGFLLYKELSRRIKSKIPLLAECFAHMARDEARHAGFLNRALVAEGIEIDLPSLSGRRPITWFPLSWVLYTVFLSEKIGYWRYILIKRHLEKNPANKFAPLFDYFDAWCQDENRHGDIFNMLLQCWPGMTKGIRGKLLSRLFLWLVFLTHSLTVAERSNFYELLGMDARQFDTEVIKATNRSARRAFPVVFKLTGTNFMAHRDGIVHCFQQLQAKAAQGWRFDCFLIRLKLVGHGLRQFLSPMELA